MRSHRRRAQLGLLAAFVVLILSVVTLVWVPRQSHPIAVAGLGTRAPDFELRDLVGRRVRLSDFRGQAVVLYFGSTRDAVTAAYDSRLNALARRYSGDERVRFIAVDVTRPGEARIDPITLRNEIEASQRPFPTLVDVRGAVASRYSVGDTFPLIVLINSRGRIGYRGPFDDHPDIAFTTRPFCVEALREVLGAPGATLARSN